MVRTFKSHDGKHFTANLPRPAVFVVVCHPWQAAPYVESWHRSPKKAFVARALYERAFYRRHPRSGLGGPYGYAWVIYSRED